MDYELYFVLAVVGITIALIPLWISLELVQLFSKSISRGWHQGQPPKT